MTTMDSTAARLAKFAAWCLERGPWEGDELSGDDVQDKAVELGIIVETKYDPAVHGGSEYADAGDPWFVLAPDVAKLA